MPAAALELGAGSFEHAKKGSLLLMHVEWERLCEGNGKKGKRLRLEALLVERSPGALDGGSKVVQRLACVEERFLICKAPAIRAFHQGIFWSKAAKKLDSLRLDPAQRGEIESAISQRVPKPGPDWSLWCVACVPKYD